MNTLYNDGGYKNACKEGPEEDENRIDRTTQRTTTSYVRSHNVGNSNYAEHKIQPWDIWLEYKLNPWDADIVKRVLRKKGEPGMSVKDARVMDYLKIIHICEERIRQLNEGYEL